MTLEGELPLAQREVAVYETIWLSAAQTPHEGRSVKWAGRAGLSAAFWDGRGCSVLYLTEGEEKKKI